jgi:hypothetical protein
MQQQGAVIWPCMLCMAMSIAETLAVDEFRCLLWYMLQDRALPCRSRLAVAVAAAARLLLRACKQSSPCAPHSNSKAATMNTCVDHASCSSVLQLGHFERGTTGKGAGIT